MKLSNCCGLEQNVGPTDRIMSITAGTVMLVSALTRKRVSKINLLLSGYFLFRGVTGHCAAYKYLLHTDTLEEPSEHITIRASVNINRSTSEVYTFWRRLENLPLFMEHLENVNQIDNKLSEWRAKIPGGIGTISWRANILKEIPDRHISWHSLPNSDVENYGTVNFRESGADMTQVDAEISYRAPGGVLGENVAKLLTPVFKNMVKKDIKNLKEYMETGNNPTTNGG
ncbi:MAG: YgaP-like transmembrane domain [Chloroflexota bacterium]|jgi:uncharacterized membrane protein|nr:YgaP-like transmembrane domain [Lentimicrobium sp.]